MPPHAYASPAPCLYLGHAHIARGAFMSAAWAKHMHACVAALV